MRETLPAEDSSQIGPGRKQVRKKAARRRKRRLLSISLGFLAGLLLFIVAGIGVAFKTPFGNHWRLLAAETIASTRHFQYARYITTAAEYHQILQELDGVAVKSSDVKKISVPPSDPNTSSKSVTPSVQSNPVQVIPLHENGFTGDVVLVKNPKLVRLVPAHVHGDMGEYVDHMAKRVGAITGMNASGFQDPNGEGWGGIPVGLEYVNGKVMQASKADPSWATVGFTQQGVMIMGNYSVSDLQKLGVRDAMQFHPELVVNGQPTITQGDGGWGAGPRTAIGQAADGTVIFVVINGRFHGGSGLGATQRQVMDIMLRYHAVNACAMDGGSSSVLYNNGKVINSPSTLDPHGSRHLPDAWMVFSSVSAANAIGN